MLRRNLRVLHLSPLALGGILATGSAGALLGSVSARRLAQRVGICQAWCVATVVSSLAWVLVPLAHGAVLPFLLILAFGANGAGMAIVNICIKTLRAQVIPPLLLGRITSAYMLCSLGVVPIGAVMGGVLQGIIGMRATLLVAALTTMLAIPCVWRVRQSQEWIMPDEDEAEHAPAIPAEAA